MMFRMTSVGLAVLILSLPIGANNDHRTPRPLKVDGCTLLEHPGKYNARLVEVEGTVYSDFEHFDLRFLCDGYLKLETSELERDIKKFGFRTRNDAEMKKLEALLRSPDMNPSNGRHWAKARVIGLFRCHYDFPNCSDISRYGDSSIVIRSVDSVASFVEQQKMPME